MTTRIKPALTDDEWAEIGRKGDYNKAPLVASVYDGLRQYPPVVSDRLDALAALCLKDQPFGFTRQDAWESRSEYMVVTQDVDGVGVRFAVFPVDLAHGVVQVSVPLALWLMMLNRAGRIAALLPPEKD